MASTWSQVLQGGRGRCARGQPRSVADGLGVAVDVHGHDVIAGGGVRDGEPSQRGVAGVVGPLEPGHVRPLGHKPVLSYPPTLDRVDDGGCHASTCVPWSWMR